MKVIDGVIYYTLTEVAQLCGKSAQTVKLWNKKSDELEAAGKERLIPRPHIEPNSYRYWSNDDAQKIVQYATQTHKERYGNMVIKGGE